MDDNIKKFMESVTWTDYSRIGFEIVAGVQSDGLFPLGGRVILSRDEFEDQPALLSRGSDFVVVRGSDSVEVLRTALVADSPDRIEMGGLPFVFSQRHGHHCSWNAVLATDFGERRIDWPARMLTLAHIPRWDYLQRSGLDPTDEHFGSLRPIPFSSLGSALRFVGDEPDPNLRSGFSIFAPVFARLEDPRVDVSTARASVVVESALDPIDLDMQLAFSPRIPGLVPIVVGAQSWTNTSEHRWTVEANLPAGSRWADVTLSARGRNISSRVTYAPSLSVQTHTILAGGTKWLRGLLEPPPGRDRAQAFERGVVAMLALGGLRAVPYGHNGYDRYVDLVAFAGHDRVLVGECTVDTPSPDKMAKLRGRTDELRMQLHVGPNRPLALSAVFAPMSATAMPAELAAKAKELGVALLWGDRMRQVLTHVEAGDPADLIFDLLRSFAL